MAFGNLCIDLSHVGVRPDMFCTDASLSEQSHGLVESAGARLVPSEICLRDRHHPAVACRLPNSERLREESFRFLELALVGQQLAGIDRAKRNVHVVARAFLRLTRTSKEIERIAPATLHVGK